MGKKINTSIIHSGSDPKIHFGSINDPIYKNVLPPLSILNSADKKELTNNLEKLNFL